MLGWCECEANVYVRSICILRLYYVYLVVFWGQWYVVRTSVVCGVKWYVGISAMWGKRHGRSTVCLRSVV